MLGQRLAERFVIRRFIARGGMGEVYEALDIDLRSNVAVKTILPAFATDAGVVERFRREVMLARRVTHANVCRIYELYSIEAPTGEPLKFLTMEFLEGESLAQRLKRVGRLSIAEALPLLRQMAAALDAAHSKGIVHRDFKPSNVMLTPVGDSPPSESGAIRVVVTDFGIARALVAGTENEGTQTGAVVGTPQYMAPEQLAGGSLMPAADVYALGIVMYEMVTGRLPTAGATLGEAFSMWVKETRLPLRSEVRGLGGRWNRAVLRCLEHEPTRRFSTAGEVVRFVEKPAPLVSRRGVLGLVLVGTALAVGVLIIPDALRRHSRTVQAAAFHPRVSVAFAGFTNEGELGDQKWVAPTLTAMLEMELDAGKSSVRVAPGTDVGLAKRSLGIADADVASPEAAQRLNALLSTQWVITGTVRSSVQAAGQVEVHLSLRGPDGTLKTAALDSVFSPDELLAASDGIGERLRDALGVTLSTKEAEHLRAKLPRSLAAARLFADGVERRTRRDYEGAEQAFAASTSADGSFSAGHRMEAETWQTLGNHAKARAAAQRARDTARELSPSDQREIEALLFEASGDKAGSRRIRQQLFDNSPDDPDLAQDLMDTAPTPEVALDVLDRWRRVSPVPMGNLGLQISEAASLDWSGDSKRGTDAYDRVEQKAKELGANGELGDVLIYRSLRPDVKSESVLEYQKLAEAAYIAAHDAVGIARVKNLKARRLKTAAAYAEVLADYRRLGLHTQVVELLLQIARTHFDNGDLATTEATLRELDDNLRSIDEPEGANVLDLRAFLAWRKGDLLEARKILHEMRRKADIDGKGPVGSLNSLETFILTAEDRLPEARAIMERSRVSAEVSHDRDRATGVGLNICRNDCQAGRPEAGLACLKTHSAAGPSFLFLKSLVEAECRLAGADMAGADRALDRGWDLAMQIQEWPAYFNVWRARVEAGKGHEEAAQTRLRRTLSDAQHRQWGLPALEAELALGEIELRLNRTQGQRRLNHLESSAKAKGFLRIARLAREALEGPPSKK